jgi:CheY-like chemotaxis protein
VLLPIAAEHPIAEPPSQESLPETRRGRILVVEDEPLVAQLTCKILEFGSYDVSVAHNGPDALKMLAKDAPRIDLLLTDVAMPKMRGTTLARLAQEENPEMPVLFMSGYPGNLDAEFGGEAKLIAKPFTPYELLRHVAEALQPD